MKFKNFLNEDLDKDIELKKKIFNFIIKNLKHSIFNLFSFNEFKKIYFNYNKKFIYINFVNNEINCLLTYLNKENEVYLRKNFLKFFLKNPLKFIIFIINPINLFKNISPPKDYLQLFHFVNLNLKFIDRKKKYEFINYVHKIVIKNEYKGIYVIYRNSNIFAKKYYQNNEYKTYKKNFFYTLALKKFWIFLKN